MENRSILDADKENGAAGQKRTNALGVFLEPVGSPARAALERHIAAKFAEQYGARLNQFHPYLLTLKKAETPLVIAGLRPARDETLYLENYLECLAEQAVSRVFKTPVDREQIVEIGNLVSSESGASYLMFSVLAPLLRVAGFRWVMCTATAQVEGMLNKMGLAPQRICVASAARLGDAAANWGSYYESQPHVIAGDLGLAASRIGSQPHLSAFIDGLDGLPAAIGKLRPQRL